MRIDESRIEVVDDKVAEILRKKTGLERLEMVWDSWTLFCQRMEAHLRGIHPEWTSDEIQKEIVKRVLSGTR